MPNLGELMVIAVNVRNGKIEKVVGVEQGNITNINTALDNYGFPAEEIKNYSEVEKELTSKPTDRCAFMLHTTSSPGCTWVFQDGWWRRVCN